MAFMTDTSRSSGFLSGLREVVVTLRDAWSRHTVFRNTYSELSALSSRELSDLGIQRSMITRLAYEAAYGKNA